jgi:hypothetical protein
MSKKFIALLIVVIAIAGFVIYRAFSPATVDTAISYIDDGRYAKAHRVLDSLSKTAHYEEGERIYYYRLKALLGFINELNSDYEEERETIDKSKENKLIDKLKRDIEKINKKEGLDFILVTEPKCYIFTAGKLYDEFIALYPGSRYRESIDFEILQFMMGAHVNTMDPIIEFYKRYPETTYLSSLVNILFKALASPSITGKEHTETLSSMLEKFCNKYASSAQYYRIFRCKGENVNLRDSSGTFGQITGKLDKGEIVVQLERSMDSVQIGDVRDYWYRVVSVSGSRGWVFGKYLEQVPVKQAQAVEEEKFTIDERFATWIDSNTPEGWQHYFHGYESAIRFVKSSNQNIVKVNTQDKGGLYKKTGSFQNITCKVKGRLIQGNVILLGVVGYGGYAYVITLMPKSLDACGYHIPYDTSLWHEYEMRSEGKIFSLYIDGELVARKISPVKHPLLTSAGIFILVCQDGGSAEIEYVKIK